MILVTSVDYGKELIPPLRLRADMRGLVCTVSGSALCLEGDKERISLTLAELILHDLRPFELARLIDLLPIELRDKRRLLPEAMRRTREPNVPAEAARIRAALHESPLFIPEGFLRFRMQHIVEDWARAVDAAGEGLILAGDTFSNATAALFSDGSCVISDESGRVIECSWRDEASLVALVSMLAPQRLAVCDLSFGEARRAAKRLLGSFAPRASLFVLDRG